MTRKQQVRRRYPFAFQKDQTIRAFNRCQVGGGDGIRNMPAYGSQIPVADRWAIVAYVRALQKSQHARLEEVPPGQRSGLQ